MKTLFNVYGIHEALIDDNGNLREDLRPGQIVEAIMALAKEKWEMDWYQRRFKWQVVKMNLNQL